MEPPMSMPTVAEDSLGRALFGQAKLGDIRRTERLIATFDQFARHPGGTLPEKLASPADLKALYRLCACPAVTHAALIESSRSYTLTRIAEHSGPVLLLHDATELDYSSLRSLADQLGQIGTGRRRGYICQNVLAVDADSGDVLGLVDQVLHCRAKTPKKETLDELRNRATRESLLWLKGAARAPSAWQLIDVADQGASTFEFLEYEILSGRRFVIRNGKPRKVYGGHQRTGEPQLLSTYIASQPELGRFTMTIQAQKGRKARAAGEFMIRGGAVLVLPPHAKRGHHGDDPLPMYVVRVTELNPPKGEKPIEWELLTNEAVILLEDALRVIGWYERRWIVEEYHKGLKTGCGIETLQFTAVARLEPAIALLSALALTLLNLRDLSRRPDAQTRSAETVFAKEYVEALSVWRHGESRPLTIHEFCLALARLGGHQNRQGDHPPGWQILWRGWTKLQVFVDGYHAAQRKRCG
jgi:hypothetical protein